MAINKARRVAPRSNKRMKNFGTILKFLILNILFLISFKLRGVFEVINEEAWGKVREIVIISAN
jgi:hypothetical protein